MHGWCHTSLSTPNLIRTGVKNDFKKDFLKLMKNSMFGKTIRNIRKNGDIKLVTNHRAYLRKVMKPNFEGKIWFSNNLIGCEMGKIGVLMKKPIYLGQTILDLSKIIMYKFHNNYIKWKYGTNLWLCYIDTDSLVYDIKNDNFYEDIVSDVKARFNKSSYSPSHSLPIGVNKKVICLMKDELGGRIMTEIMALRSKLYTYETLSGGGARSARESRKAHHGEDNGLW